MSDGNYFKEVGPALVENGYQVVPLRPGEKRPRGDDWPKFDLSKEDIERMAANGSARDGVGINTRHTPVLDLDIEDEEAVQEILAWVKKEIGPAPTRIGRAPRVALVFKCDQPFKHGDSNKYENWDDTTHQIQILCDGQQMAAYHIHPDTKKPYKWTGDGIAGIPRDALTTITPEQIDRLFVEFERIAKEKAWTQITKGSKSRDNDDPDWDDDERELAHYKRPLDIELDELREKLFTIDANDRETWVSVGMALHHQTDGSEEGFDLWDEWSQTADNYGGVTESRWEGFAADTKTDPITARFIVKLAEENIDPLSEFDDEPPPEDDPMAAFWLGETDTTEEPPHQVVEELFARGQCSLISAQPNTGKSVLMLDISICVALGESFRGREVEQGTAVYLAAESPETIKARGLAERNHRGLGSMTRKQMPLLVTQTPFELTTLKGRKKLARWLSELVKADPSTNLVTLDTLRNATPGVQENDAEQMGQIINFVAGLAKRLNIHIVVVHHLTKSGLGYSGSGVLGAVVDTELVMTRGEKEFEGLVRVEVRQQRGMNSRGEEMWFKMTSAETGRTTNFGKPETAPVIAKHMTEEDLRFYQAKVVEAQHEQKQERIEDEMASILDAMKSGHTTLAALMEITGLSRNVIGDHRKELESRGALVREGEKQAARYSIPTEGEE